MPLKKRKTAFPEEIVECGKKIPLVFKELKKRKKKAQQSGWTDQSGENRLFSPQKRANVRSVWKKQEKESFHHGMF